MSITKVSYIMELTWVTHHDPLASIGRERPMSLHLTHSGQDPRRSDVECFIRDRFAAHYQAKIHHFMPYLFSLENGAGQVQGAFGLRSAEHESLFLERYLDEPIEQAINQNNGQPPIKRSEIVEVGNLAAMGSASARLLIVSLTDLLATLGFRWVVFTGTPGLLNSFHRLKIELRSLADADPARMGNQLADWGTYYDCHPKVTAGSVPLGHQSLLQQGIYHRLGYLPFYTLENLPNVACC